MKRNKIFIALLLAIFSTLWSCSADPVEKANDKMMDRAERVMNSAPDSAMAILDSVSTDRLKSDRDKARFALLKSIALDKNYIDTTTFDVLQPAIDYYLKKGTPDEKLRTYYYRAVIFDNQGNQEEAVKNLVQAIELGKEITDSNMLAQSYVLQGYLFMQQGMNLTYANNSLKAYEIYKSLNNQEKEKECLRRAISAYFAKNLFTSADSLLQILNSRFYNPYDRGVLHYNILNAIYNRPKEHLKNYLDSVEVYAEDDYTLLDIALGYNKLNDGKSAMDALSKIKEISKDNQQSYDGIKAESNYNLGNYKEAYDGFRRMIEKRDSINSIIFSQEIKSVEKNYNLEKNVDTETQKRKLTLLISLSIILGLFLLCAIIYIKLRENKIQALSLKEKNLNLEIETLKLQDEKNSLKMLYQEGMIETNILRERVSDVENEKDELSRKLEIKENTTSTLRNIIRKQLKTTQDILTAKITSNKKLEKTFREIENEIFLNKNQFLENLLSTFEVLYPKFMGRLKEANLDKKELYAIMLFGLQLNGKEVGDYLEYKSIYNLSRDIRRKLGLSSNDTNLDKFIQTLLMADEK